MMCGTDIKFSPKETVRERKVGRAGRLCVIGGTNQGPGRK